MNDFTPPPLFSGDLTATQVPELFRQWAATHVLAVLLRDAGRRCGDAQSTTLATASAAFRDGASVQVRYLHDGAEWWDTLRPTPGGARLVRIQQVSV